MKLKLKEIEGKLKGIQSFFCGEINKKKAIFPLKLMAYY